jgi:hypothetical protein
MITFKELGVREFNVIVVKVCKKHFSLESQNENYPERDYLGKSWLANFYLACVNDYINFSTFYKNEIADYICNETDGSETVCDYGEFRTQDLFYIFKSAIRLGSEKTLEEIGLKLEKLLDEIMSNE